MVKGARLIDLAGKLLQWLHIEHAGMVQMMAMTYLHGLLSQITGTLCTVGYVVDSLVCTCTVETVLGSRRSPEAKGRVSKVDGAAEDGCAVRPIWFILLRPLFGQELLHSKDIYYCTAG